LKSCGKEKNRILLRPSCITTFRTLYGIGQSKAKKINGFLLNHPSQQKFENDIQIILSTTIGANILTRIPFGGKVRMTIYNNLEKNIINFNYKAKRLFQNLPTKGQRTRANACTSRNRNPYQIVELNEKFFKENATKYKRIELMHNQRYDELKAFDKKILNPLLTSEKKK